jgi:hypothetical protein
MSFPGYYKPDGIKRTHKLIVPSADFLSPRPDAIYVVADGSATLVDEDGVAIEYALVAGQILPFSPVKVTAASAVLLGWK